MKRTLIDVTDLESWSGAHGGIQRVVYALTKAYYLESQSHHHEIDFIAFDRDSKKFYSTNFTRIYNTVEGILPNEDVSSKNDIHSVASSGYRDRLTEVINRNILLRKVVFLLRKIKHKLRSNNSPVVINETKAWVEFTRDDEVLVLGMAWENLDIQKTLTSEREERHFKLIQLVYDMIICLYPHLHHPDNYKPYMTHMLGVIANSDLLLAISESTKNDILSFAEKHNIIPPKINVIRLGDELGKRSSESIKPSFEIQDDFIVCVGTVEVRKNHSLLYYAYKLAEERNVNLPQLIIVGGGGWFSGDIQYLINTDPATQDKIKIIHGLSDRELSWLYENCKFSIYPSMYEGWGLPIAESLAYGKLCIASHTSSMTEIAGGLIDYFSPFNSEECLDKIIYYSDIKNLRPVEENITKKYSSTSWMMTFEQVIDAIEEAR